MGKREGFEGPLVHHQVAVYWKRISACMHRSRKQASHNLVWVPKIPSWEKEFCYRIGSFTWDNFLEAKKLIGFTHKILEWNDSAAEEAFHRTKKRFFAMINGLHNPNESSDNPNPDLYIDEIDWDDHDEENSELLDGLGLAVDEKEEHEDVPDYYHIRMEDIKPTGWNTDFEETSRGNVLTGLIVGC